jgi:hypothetical protein
MTYQPYPTGGGGNIPAQGLPQPPSIQTAVKLMYAGAAFSVVLLVVNLFSIGALKTALRKANATASKPLTASQLHSLEGLTVAIGIFVAVVGVALWLWMARANGAGKSWARIVAAVLFGFNTLSLLSAVTRPNALETRIFDIVTWLIGLAATVFLWRKDSSEFYARSSSKLR